MSLPYTSTYDGEEAGSIIPILVLSRACVLIDPTEHVCLRAEDETAERIDAQIRLIRPPSDLPSAGAYDHATA